MAKAPIRAPGYEAQAAHAEKLKAAAEVERENEIRELAALLQQPQMRRFLWRFMAWAQPFADQMQSNFGWVGHGLGRAAAAKWLLDEIGVADYNAWLLMQQENHQRELDRKLLEEIDAKEDQRLREQDQ